MKTDIAVTPQDRSRLEVLVGDRNTSAKIVWRARIVLASADGESVKAIARLTGKSKPCVWRWQKRFAEEGVDGLLRDKTRPPGRKPLPQKVKLKVLKMTASVTPPNATHWSVRTMAKAAGISHTSVQRIWSEAGLKPRADTEAMQEFLDRFSKTIADDEHVVMFADQAGWHIANDLAVPDNITLLPLPAYSPELNPVERLWLYLKERFLSHRLLDDYDAIVDAACLAWNRIVADVGRIKSLCTYPWIEAITS